MLLANLLFSMQIAISNPNREVLLTLSKSGVVEMIGKEWYFVRVHDAVQVCLQHVQGIKETPSSTADPVSGEKPSYLQRLLKQRLEDSEIAQLESGYSKSPVSEDNPQLEPLLSRKP